jgi:hypothetical protein
LSRMNRTGSGDAPRIDVIADATIAQHPLFRVSPTPVIRIVFIVPPTSP